MKDRTDPASVANQLRHDGVETEYAKDIRRYMNGDMTEEEFMKKWSGVKRNGAT